VTGTFHDRPGRLAVLVNPLSSRSRAGMSRLEAVLERAPHVMVRYATNPIDSARALREILATPIDVLAACGGDGTLQLVFDSFFNEQRTHPLPLLAVLPGGTTNMIANDVGAKDVPAVGLERLLRAMTGGHLDGTRQTRRLIVLRTSPDARPAYGLFFGAAGVVQGTMISRRSVDRIGMRDWAGPVAGILSLLGPMLLGRNPIRPVAASFRFDGNALPDARYLAIGITTMDRLFLGIHPYWDTTDAPIKVTLIREHPRSLLRAIPPLLRGQAVPLLSPENGYITRNVSDVEIGITERTVLDGEFYDPVPGHPLRLSVGPEVTFVRG
jgi:diacylglycerol kinase (ATP)